MGDAKERLVRRRGVPRHYFPPAFRAKNPSLVAVRAGEGATPVLLPSERQATEAKFQFSFRGHLWPQDDRGRHDLWFGYTQVSHWQLWNGDASRPFRESSYEPELIYTYEPARLDWAGWRVGHFGLSLNHNSNGQGGELAQLEPRHRLRARGEGFDARHPARMDAPARERHRRQPGHRGLLRSRGPAGLPGLRERHATHGHGAAYAAHRRPQPRGNPAGPLRAPVPGFLTGVDRVDSARYVQGYHGYAESLIDYNRKDSYPGMGCR
ncbi:MAG: phospholipase A [Betaproteobacteria bacterium]|nr:phospholipase A [Betaproteobacteria bacterium]